MSFGEILDQAREGTLNEVRRLKEAKEGRRLKVYLEAVPRTKDGTPACAADGLRLPLRYDVAFIGDSGGLQTEYGSSVTTTIDGGLSFRWADRLEVQVESVCWDYMRFEVAVAESAIDYDKLRSWYLAWFDAEEEKTPDRDGLNGIIHFLSDPTYATGSLSLIVDFGSSPVDAFEQLLDVFAAMGATKCSIGKTHQSENEPP